MLEIQGDFWKESNHYHILVCTTNRIVKSSGELVMGGGIALDFANRYRGISLPMDWGLQTSMGSNLTHTWVKENCQWLVGFPTKKHYRDDSLPALIEQSARLLKIFVDTLRYEAEPSVLLTRPGCGLGNLKWSNVKPILEKYLDHRFHVIER